MLSKTKCFRGTLLQVLKDDTTLAENNVDENGFLVVMVKVREV